MIPVKKMAASLLALCLTASLAIPASAATPLDYTFSGTGDPEYGKPTSIEVVYTADGGAMKNEDVSKNAALVPPGFGSRSADTLNTGDYLTPDLAPGGMPVAGSVINGTSSAVIAPGSPLTVPAPAVSGASSGSTMAGGTSISTGTSAGTVTGAPADASAAESSGFTEVIPDLVYSAGHLGTLSIPAIGLSVKVYEGTDNATLAKGVGHFEDTSIWSGNIGIAGHNRGVNSYFGKIHTLEVGNKITLTTKLGTRNYEVVSVSKVSETDRSALAATGENMLTLYTCVRNVSDQRWCVQAISLDP